MKKECVKCGRVVRNKHKCTPKYCEYCGKLITSGDRRNRYCNIECHHKTLEKIHNKVCIQCNLEFETKYKRKNFCSRSCSATYNNKKYPKRGLPDKYCKECNKKLINKKSTYCSSQCCSDSYYNNYITEWLAGKNDGSGHSGCSMRIRRWLFEKHNRKCSKCGWSEINQHTKTLPLEVEHINGNPYDNRPENLDLLCPNCHAMTATYRGANRGNGKRSYLKNYEYHKAESNMRKANKE